MTVEQIRAYILDNLKKTGKKPETVITTAYGDKEWGFIHQYRMMANVKKGDVTYASPEYVSLMVISESVTPKLKRQREESIDIDLEDIVTIADAE